MHKWTQIGSSFLLLIFPFIIYLALQYGSLDQVSLALVSIYTIRLFIRKKDHMGKKSIRQVPLLIFMLLALLSLLTKEVKYILLQPFFLSIILYCILFLSLIYPPTVIERIYMSRKKKLSKSLKAYCRTMNKVWCLFLCINAAGAFYTAFYCSISIWALFNGLITYLLAGALLSIEYLVYRVRINKHQENISIQTDESIQS
jgi:uncharacterized membrane protein